MHIVREAIFRGSIYGPLSVDHDNLPYLLTQYSKKKWNHSTKLVRQLKKGSQTLRNGSAKPNWSAKFNRVLIQNPTCPMQVSFTHTSIRHGLSTLSNLVSQRASRRATRSVIVYNRKVTRKLQNILRTP